MRGSIATSLVAGALVLALGMDSAVAMSCSERFDQCVASCGPGDAPAACLARCERGRTYCLSIGCWHGRNRQTVCGFIRS